MLDKLTSDKNYKVIFFNFFDSIITRNASDNQLLKLWSKNMIREVGIDLRIDELYQIRKKTDLFLAEAIDKEPFEVPYKSIIDEVYTRLKCTNSITTIDKATFSNYFKNSDYKTETLVQEPNKDLIKSLKKLKNKGIKLYCVANFKGSSELLK